MLFKLRRADAAGTMAGLPGSISPTGARRTILAVGFTYLGLGAFQAGREVLAGNGFLDALSAVLLVGVPAVLIVLVGHRLDAADIEAQVYPRILGWAGIGFVLLSTVVGIRVGSPGVTIDQPMRSALYATAIGVAAGLGIGVYEGKAISRARLAERRSQELERTKAQLEETVQRLRELNNRLEQFAFAASHDLKEPIRMVTTYLQLLERRYADDLDEEAEEYMGYAIGGARRMRNMVDSLLAYSRVTTGGEPKAPTDANAVVDDALASLEPRIEETGADITVGELPTVIADAGQLSAVFRNVIANALAYSGDRCPRVEIWAEPTDGMWRFAIRDEGIGIDPAYHDKIFEAFERLSTDTESAEAGAGGIGLALCRRIIEAHGGEIWVDSAAGEGATFSFTIPMRREGADVLDPDRGRYGGVPA